jgi:hypothetical protein
MSKIVWMTLLGAFFSFQIPTDQGMPGHLVGVVVSEQGTAVPGVKIFAWHDDTTDAQGRFDLPSRPDKDEILYFDKDGFRPTAVIIKSGTETLRVVLEDDNKTTWLVPECKPTDTNSSPTGYEVKFLIPKHAQVRKIQDIDYQEYFVRFEKKIKPLELWWRPLVVGSTESLILRSASFEERSIRRKSGEIAGDDMRGITQDGKFWRTANFPESSATYEGVSKDVALAYDRIIDSACQLEKATLLR